LAAERSPTLTMLIMDPLSLPLSCACVDGKGQRQYNRLKDHLEKGAGVKVNLVYDESLILARKRTEETIQLIVGKDSMVRFDAKQASIGLQPMASLTDRDGKTGLSGSFIVRHDSGITNLAQLSDRHIALGPEEDHEANGAAREYLQRMTPSARNRIEICGSMDSAALMVHDGEADAAVISDFLLPLMEGCGKLDKGTVRAIAKTDPIPFIKIFATDALPTAIRRRLLSALDSVKMKRELLDALESRDGFITSQPVYDWHDWRGPGRTARVPQIPARLPERPRKIWTYKTTGLAVAGVAADKERVIVPDKSADGKNDIFTCVSAQDSTKILWRLEYPAGGRMEYSNSPRATPVIHDGLVYLQGAFGHLHCLDVATGRVIWKRHLFGDYDSELLNWGASSPPLIVDDRLIINPGAAKASIAALNRKNGRLIWKTPGHAAAYSAFVHGRFGGIDQIIGYDAGGLGGWDSETGQRLWEMVPPDGTDFNVLTPVIVDGQLLLGSENNGTRLYRFEDSGALNPLPLRRNEDLAPDTCTPVIVNGRIFATAYGELFCVRLADMKTLWRKTNDMFYDHSNVMGGPDRVMVWTMSGDLLLLDATVDDCRVISHLRPFGKEQLNSMSHPAFVGDRIYLRSKDELRAFSLRVSE